MVAPLRALLDDVRRRGRLFERVHGESVPAELVEVVRQRPVKWSVEPQKSSVSTRGER